MSTVVQVPDTDTMSLADLRKAAEEEAKQQKSTNTNQNRNSDGTFAAKNPVVDNQHSDNVVVDDPDDEPDTLYRRTIDLGDGSGVQVFEAESLEELVDKIADAQTNATKKIRTQEAELKKLRVDVAPKPKEFSKDDEYVFSQELMTKPTEAFKKIFKELTGYEIQDFASVKQAADAAKVAMSTNEALATFIATHGDYIDGGSSQEEKEAGIKNSTAMTLAMKGVPVTSENLHKAYLELKKSGLLVLKTVGANSGQEPTQQQQERIVPTAVERVTSPRTRKTSGLSTQSRSTVQPVNTEPSEDEAYTMPIDKLRQLANKQLATR